VLAAAALGQPGVPCSTCHEDQSKKIQGSTHAKVDCATCHPRHENFPHASGVPKPACAQCHPQVARDDASGVHGQARKSGGAAPDCAGCHGSPHQTLRPSSAAFRRAVPETCGMCHDTVVAAFQQSVHGKALAAGVRNAPLCTDCHGEHNIIGTKQARSPVNPDHIRATCARCHDDVRLSRRFGLPTDVVLSFDASFHGLAARSGIQSVANCASCHGYHNILASPTRSPRSTSRTSLPHAGSATQVREPVSRWVRSTGWKAGKSRRRWLGCAISILG
jgi:hypothetical protein